MDFPDLACDQRKPFLYHPVVLSVGYPDAFVLVGPILVQTRKEIMSGDHEYALFLESLIEFLATDW